MEDNWGLQERTPFRNIYDIEDQEPKRQRRDARRDLGEVRRGNPSTDIAKNLYSKISEDQGIHTEGGPNSREDYYQNMGQLNYPADEQFRKESRIMKNRVERDLNMKWKKKAKLIKIKDVSTDEFVIPCTFPSAMDVKEEQIVDKPPSSLKIEEFLKMPIPEIRWAVVNEEGDEDEGTRRDEGIEEVMVRKAVEAASALQNSHDAICLSFESYPPAFKRRNTMLRTIVIDGCAVMKQVNFKYEVPWNPTGGTTNTFRGNKLLVVKPLVELAMRFLLQGHKTVIILPSYYMIPVFAGVRQKVDNLAAFNALVETGIVQFIEEASIEEMHSKLFEENGKLEGTWVSTADLERIILAYHKGLKKEGEENPEKKDEKPYAEFTHRLTPFFYDNKLVLPLHMSTARKTILLADKLLHHNDGNMARFEERRRNQMTMEEQTKLLLALQDIFDLPLRLLRGMMMFRRILKEIEGNEEENKKITDAVACKDLEDATRRAFEDDDFD